MCDSVTEMVNAVEMLAEAVGLARVCEPMEKGECCLPICVDLVGDVRGV